MIFGARLQNDGPDGTYQVLDSDEGSQVVGPFTDDALRELDKSLDSFRLSELEREAVRREREAAGNITLREYHLQDPEIEPDALWLGDLHRKAVRERGDEAA